MLPHHIPNYLPTLSVWQNLRNPTRFRNAATVSAMLVASTLNGCATLNTDTKQAEDALISGLSGVWDNQDQYANTAETLKVPPSVNGNWLDLQHAIFKQIEAPEISNKVLYLEWRNKTVDGVVGAISRQRIWSFRTDSNNIVRMDFYAFVDGKAWSENSTNFAKLQPAELRGYGSACALYFTQVERGWSAWNGEISAKDCSITAASGRRMGINARLTLTAAGALEYQESGVLDDGKYAFRVPPTQPYKFVRRSK